jgi:NADH-quinone oxidoreductase subunit M
MSFVSDHIVSIVIFWPLLCAIVLLFLPRRFISAARSCATAALLVEFLMVVLLFSVVKADGNFDFVEGSSWASAAGMYYRVGVDGFSAALMLAASALGLASAVMSFNSVMRRVSQHYAVILALTAMAIGAFASLDVVLFFFFWQAAAFAMIFGIGVWSSHKSTSVAVRFTVFSQAASAVMLISIATLVAIAGTSDLAGIYAHAFTATEQMWLFFAFVSSAAVIIGMFPFHIWVRDVADDAPIGLALMSVGALTKIGIFILLRIALPMFPMAAGAFSHDLMIFALASMAFGLTYAIFSATEARRYVAASISFAALAVFGIASLNTQAISGGVYLAVVASVIFAVPFVASTSTVDIALMSIPAAFVYMAASFPGVYVVLQGSFQTETYLSAIATALYFALVMVLFARATMNRVVPDGGGAKLECHHVGVGIWCLIVSLSAVAICCAIYPEAIFGKLWGCSDVLVELTRRFDVIVPADIVK